MQGKLVVRKLITFFVTFCSVQLEKENVGTRLLEKNEILRELHVLPASLITYTGHSFIIFFHSDLIHFFKYDSMFAKRSRSGVFCYW